MRAIHGLRILRLMTKKMVGTTRSHVISSIYSALTRHMCRSQQLYM
jgi:hypothetical protein